MSLDKKQFSTCIKQFNFRELFNVMGWNNDKTTQSIVVDNETYTLRSVAEKSGLKVLTCKVSNLPTTPVYKKLDTQIRKLFFHYLLICIDETGNQKWIIPIRKSEGRDLVTIDYSSHQVPEFLFQKVSQLSFSLEQEEHLTIVDVSKLINETFIINSEKITKQFYDTFKKEHRAFLQFIKGISDETNQEWYASLMLNRLMFCYFIQKKGFLDNNKNYLRDKLTACKAKKEKVNFYSFYRDFLLVLFHKGLNEPDQSQDNKIEIGKIPYLNGGLFDEHELEKTNSSIDIDDKAFERLFDFFDQYEWHLDTRHTASGKDINPDVIGYIFEKYINDRTDMGAYYTKEDITNYISKNCILPWLFDETKRHCPKAFNADAELWLMVKQSGDLYIYDAVKKGVSEPLPLSIEQGIKDVSKRSEWNKPATINYALPTEIWREVVDRRNRYTEVKSKIDKGGIQHINNFITYNLNIRQFAQDAVENTNDPELLKHFYKALNSVTIIDPTCGSGAFLFAAMNILEPLYESCLQRMENFVAEAPKGKYKFFEETLAQVKSTEHSNLQYFIYKSIILRNLYGVDIMKEAVEIAKLRLFLKLVATVEADYRKPNLGLEPLPDIDFNIRAGNTLVGFATEAELQKGLTYTLDGALAKPAIEEKCEIVANAFKRYKEIQLTNGDEFKEFKKEKAELNKRLKELNHELNQLLHKQASGLKYDQWLETHQPFHWFAEFYEIVQENGGFDVIIGNPPYVELKVAEKSYKLQKSEFNTGGNLHSIVAARSLLFLNENGHLGFIVPVAISNTDRMKDLRKRFVSQGPIWLSNYSIRPGKLFSGAEQRLSIYIFQRNKDNAGKLWTSKYYKWNKEEREFLFENIHLTELQTNGKQIWYKVPSSIAKSIIDKIIISSESVAKYSSGSKSVFYKNTGIGYYVTTTLQPPTCFINGNKASSSRETTINFGTEELMHIFHSILSSSLFFLFYQARSNCRDLNPSDITNFKFPLSVLNDKQLIVLSKKLQKSLEENSWFQIRNQKQTGEVKIQSFTSSLSKHILDEIDTVLAKHYGFTNEELDFIINYDIKYRMGKELESEDEE